MILCMCVGLVNTLQIQCCQKHWVSGANRNSFSSSKTFDDGYNSHDMTVKVSPACAFCPYVHEEAAIHYHDEVRGTWWRNSEHAMFPGGLFPFDSGPGFPKVVHAEEHGLSRDMKCMQVQYCNTIVICLKRSEPKKCSKYRKNARPSSP